MSAFVEAVAFVVQSPCSIAAYFQWRYTASSFRIARLRSTLPSPIILVTNRLDSDLDLDPELDFPPNPSREIRAMSNTSRTSARVLFHILR